MPLSLLHGNKAVMCRVLSTPRGSDSVRAGRACVLIITSDRVSLSVLTACGLWQPGVAVPLLRDSVCWPVVPLVSLHSHGQTWLQVSPLARTDMAQADHAVYFWARF